MLLCQPLGGFWGCYASRYMGKCAWRPFAELNANSHKSGRLNESLSCSLTFHCPALIDAEKLAMQVQLASIFLVGCPACLQNFKNFFCILQCSPDQATFANVTAVQPAADNNATVVKQVRRPPLTPVLHVHC